MYTITLNGNSSNLSCDFFPPIEVSRNAKICLLGLQTNNSIPNVNEKCNRIGFIVITKQENIITSDMYSVSSDSSVASEFPPEIKLLNEIIKYEFTIPTGTYELSDLETAIQQLLSGKPIDFKLVANKITLKCEMNSTAHVDFTMPNNIASLLGFKSKIYESNVTHRSDTLVNISKINCIYIESNLVDGSFVNGQHCHIIHEFYPSVAAGFKIIEVPTHLVFYSLNCTSISHASLVLKDQNNELIDLRGEPISVRILIQDSFDSECNGSSIL